MTYATAREIVRLTGWSEVYVRQLAHRDEWRRITGRPVLYHWADVLATRGRLDNCEGSLSQ